MVWIAGAEGTLLVLVEGKWNLQTTNPPITGKQGSHFKTTFLGYVAVSGP